MPKRPLDCKSRIQRKKIDPKAEPKQKKFCPSTMVRYDVSDTDYPTKWICKMCLKALLSEDAAKNHLTKCSGQSRARLTIQAPTTAKPTEKYNSSSSLISSSNVIL